jgi:two-component system chemotaxis sensor kinase CheA
MGGKNMSESSGERDPMLEMYLFESNQLLEQLEEIMLQIEKSNQLSSENINEIFRIMHTIKGSAAMMSFMTISKLAHSLEDLFFYIREHKEDKFDITAICDLVLPVSDFIRAETEKIDNGAQPDGDFSLLEHNIKKHLEAISGVKEKVPAKAAKKAEATPAVEVTAAEAQPADKPDTSNAKKYIAKMYFADDAQMENVRAYTIFLSLEKMCVEIKTEPKNFLDSDNDYSTISGYSFYFATEYSENEIKSVFDSSMYLKSYTLNQVENYEESPVAKVAENEIKSDMPAVKNDVAAVADPQKGKLSLISVNVNKLDALMDIVGEIVISEAMVTKNPDLKDLKLESFTKAARQLRKLTDELQDIVVSIRMVPIAGTFQKMQRIVRDMSKKLNKEVDFITKGEETEVDKTIIDHLSDPLMHIIRNSMDHGIEPEEERLRLGKSAKGKVILSAVNSSGDVVISITDDGKGLDKKSILKKAKQNGLLTKPENQILEKDIYAFVMMPGFSTNETVTEFSGRGVGMDVVRRNIEEVGGSISIKSVEGQGTTISISIPLTLAIADAMEIEVGNSIYTVPTTSIKEAFRPHEKDIIHDEFGNEMIMIRGNCYPVIRMHELFGLHTEVTKIHEGVLIMIEGDSKFACIFADRLIGEQQIVVKPLPKYFNQYSLKENGVEGCTILGDGSISLILSTKNIINKTV